MTIENFVSSWLGWITQMRLSMPVMALVNSIVFDKMTRRQQVPQASQQANSEREDGSQSDLSLADILSNDRFVFFFGGFLV